MDKIEIKGIMNLYRDKNNRLNSLKNYIERNGSADKLYTNDYYLWLSFNRNNHCIVEAIKELGYLNIHEILKSKPKRYYDDFNNLKNDIEYLIGCYGRFPTVEEIKKELGIDNRIINKHGGIYEIKRIMNWVDKYNLKDATGFYNASAYEYIVATFLIKYNIPYQREEYPFPKCEGNFRCDFSLERKNGSKIYVEVWGYSSNEETEYNKVKSEKIKLYNKYNLELVSIEKNLFVNNNRIIIESKLKEIFMKYTDIKNSPLPNYNIIPTNDLSDEEILKTLIGLSKEEGTLPDVPTLKKNGKYPLYNEILKRYGSYYIFAQKFNMKNIRHKVGYWEKDKIFDCFKVIIKQNLSITRKNINQTGNSALNDAVVNSGGLIQWKLDFYIENNNSIPKEDLMWLNNVVNNQGTNIKNKVTLEQINQAKLIVEKIIYQAS